MKTVTLGIAVLFSISCHAQISQDSINKLQKAINKRQTVINSMQKEINKDQAAINSLQGETNVRTNAETDLLINDILDDLVDMKIVSDKQKVSFALNLDKMEVNEKKQSVEVLKKFVAKYKITEGYSISYARSGNTVSKTISKL